MSRARLHLLAPDLGDVLEHVGAVHLGVQDRAALAAGAGDDVHVDALARRTSRWRRRPCSTRRRGGRARASGGGRWRAGSQACGPCYLSGRPRRTVASPSWRTRTRRGPRCSSVATAPGDRVAGWRVIVVTVAARGRRPGLAGLGGDRPRQPGRRRRRRVASTSKSVHRVDATVAGPGARPRRRRHLPAARHAAGPLRGRRATGSAWTPRPAGRRRCAVRTERRATTVEVVGCTARQTAR